MIGHPHIGVNCQPMFVGRLNQCIAEKPVVRVRRKDGLSVVAALDDVLGITGKDEAGEACHGRGRSISISLLEV